MAILSRQMCSNTQIFADFSAANLWWCGDCVSGGVLTVYCDFWSEMIFAIHRQVHDPCRVGPHQWEVTGCGMWLTCDGGMKLQRNVCAARYSGIIT